MEAAEESKLDGSETEKDFKDNLEHHPKIKASSKLKSWAQLGIRKSFPIAIAHDRQLQKQCGEKLGSGIQKLSIVAKEMTEEADKDTVLKRVRQFNRMLPVIIFS